MISLLSQRDHHVWNRWRRFWRKMRHRNMAAGHLAKTFHGSFVVFQMVYGKYHGQFTQSMKTRFMNSWYFGIHGIRQIHGIWQTVNFHGPQTVFVWHLQMVCWWAWQFSDHRHGSVAVTVTRCCLAAVSIENKRTHGDRYRFMCITAWWCVYMCICCTYCWKIEGSSPVSFSCIATV